VGACVSGTRPRVDWLQSAATCAALQQWWQPRPPPYAIARWRRRAACLPRPVRRPVTTAADFHFMAAAMDMQHRTPLDLVMEEGGDDPRTSLSSMMTNGFYRTSIQPRTLII